MQTGLVHILEAAGAVTRRQQRVGDVSLAVADPTDVVVGIRYVGARRAQPCMLLRVDWLVCHRTSLDIIVLYADLLYWHI